MSKLRLQISVLLFVLLAVNYAEAQNTYLLKMHSADRDSVFLAEVLAIPSQFPSRFTCNDFINKLTADLRAKGYVTASLDSIYYDSTFANAVIFVGDIYKWADVDTKLIEPELLDAVGWRDRLFADKPMDFEQVKTWQEKMLVYLENNGYPFAKVFLDSLQMEDEKITALLKVDKGHLYKIDSIKINGDVKISNSFLQKYLDIKDGSPYNREKLKRISKFQ